MPFHSHFLTLRHAGVATAFATALLASSAQAQEANASVEATPTAASIAASSGSDDSLAPRGNLTQRETAIWTAGIADDGPPELTAGKRAA